VRAFDVATLAFARIAMGYRLLALALVVTCWAVHRACGRLDVGMDERREKLAARRSTRAA
jgi:hypothetical protein